MTVLSPSIRFFRRALAVLVVLVVAVHALTPATTPVERVAGSAFSAATYDVAIEGSAQAVDKAEMRGGNAPGPRVEEPDPAPMLASRAASVERVAYRSYRRSHRDPPALSIWSRGPPSA